MDCNILAFKTLLFETKTCRCGWTSCADLVINFERPIQAIVVMMRDSA
jgi:hypothetical protein